jgi:hypothetical protein
MHTTNIIQNRIATESFNQIIAKARRNARLTKLLKKGNGLKSYQGTSLNKRDLGVMDIPIQEITGTVGRLNDFDSEFRPLKPHLRDRWVKVAVQAREEGWPPIELFKVGKDYFVLDGHHRTSFARSQGISFVEARVWEIQSEQVREKRKPASIQKGINKQVSIARPTLRRQQQENYYCAQSACQQV